MYKLAEKV